ncbi:MAG: translocation/assembly module TamB domain-containing protein [Firmicutes bacterium]|nr:translocation/assembly module TamB domain-containing protein [Bacillota bacterium]
MKSEQRIKVIRPKWLARPGLDVRKKPGIRPLAFIIMIITAILIIFILIPWAAYFLGQQQVLTGQIQSALQKSLQKNHLQIAIKEIHFNFGKGVTVTGIRLREINNGPDLILADKANLKFNLWALLTNPRRPEASLREIEIIKPRLWIERLPDNLWNFQRYFPPSKKALQFKTMIRLRDGLVKYRDFQYGSCEITALNGKINLTQYPLIQWSLGGGGQLKLPVRVTSRGEMRIDQTAGSMDVLIRGASLPEVLGYLPPVIDCRAVSGTTDIELQLAWGFGAFWIEKGQAALHDAGVFLPGFPKPFRVKHLETAFAPERFQIKKAELAYGQTTLRFQGVFNPSSTAIDAVVKVAGLNLEDISFIKPELKDYGVEGHVDLNLKISGRVHAPVFDGNVTLKDGKAGLIQGECLERIAGKAVIVRNNLFFQQFQGFWRKYPIEITGTIENILDPYLNLTISGKELDINQIVSVQTGSGDLQAGNRVTFQARISGSPFQPEFTGNLAVDEIRYQGFPVQHLKVELSWDMAAKILRAGIQGEIGGGRLNAKGMARFNRQMVEWSISGALSGLNLGEIPTGTGLKLTGKINASIVSQGNWGQGEQLNFGNIFATFWGESLTVQNYPLDQAEGVLRWKQGNLAIDSFQVKTGRERIFGSVSWDDDRLAADLAVENILLSRLPINRKKIPLDGVLNGSVSLEGPITGLKGQINGTITGLAWDSKKIGAISGSFSYSDNTVNVLELDAVTEFGNFSAQGSITTTGKPVVKLDVVSPNVKLAGILKWLPLDPSIKIGGTAQINAGIKGDIDSPLLKGEITLKDPQLLDRKMKEGLIRFEGDLSEIRLQKFSLTSDSSFLELTGRVSRNDFNLNITGKSFDLAILQLESGGKSLQGIVTINGRLYGPFQDPVLSCGITGQDLRFGPLFYEEMAGQIQWTKEGLTILEAGLLKEQSSITVTGRILSSNPVGFDLEAKAQGFKLQDLKQSGVFPAGFDLEGQLNGSLILTGTSLQPSLQIIGGLSQGSVNTIPVTGDFNLFYSNQRIIINRIQLRQEKGTLTARGVWENNQSIKIQIQVMDFPVAVFNSLFKLPFKMGGVINSQIDFEWSVERVIGQYRVEGAAFTLNQDSLGDFQLSGAISQTGLTVNEGALSGKNGSIEIKGYLPWPQEFPGKLGLPAFQPPGYQELDFNLTLKQVSGTLLNNYLPNVTVLNGTCNGRLQLKGVLSQPAVYGELNGKDFKVEIGGLPFPIEVTQFNLAVEGNRIRLQKTKGVYGAGKITLEGEAYFHNLRELSFKIGATGTRIYYRNQYFDGYGDLNVHLEGTPDNALLSGDITVYDNKAGFLGVEPGGPVSIGWSPKLDLVIQTGKASRCRVIGFADLAVKGVVRIKGTLAAPALSGEVSSRSGVLTFYNNAFRVNQGKAVFKNAQGFNPYLEINAGLRKSNVEVFLNIKGTVEQLDIQLTSQPYLSDTELYSLLNWSQLRGDEPLTPQDVVSGNISVLTDTLFGDFLATLGQSLNVDYLYLEPDSELKGFRISVGTHVTDQLILSYSQSIFNSDQAYLWSLDYYLTPNWVLGYNYSIQEGYSWELAYRIKI